MSIVTRLAGAVALMLGFAAAAAEFEPSLDVGVIRTDNLGLTTLDPESQTIYQLTPSLRVSQESVRLTASAAYRLDAYKYDQRDDSKVYNNFDGNMSFAMVPDAFFLNAGASRSQALRDPATEIPVTDFAFTTNLVDRDDFYVGPSFEFGAGGNAVVSGDLRRTRVNYDESVESDLTDLDYDTATIGIDNYRRGRGFTWAMRYEYDHTDYGEVFFPYEYQRALVELGGWATMTTRIFGAGGKESDWETPLDPSLEASFYEVGLAQQLGERLSTEFAVGERSFGKTMRADVEYEFGRGRTSVSYVEEPRDSSDDRYARDLLVSDDPNDYLARVGTIERYLEERFQWSFTFELNRLSFNLLAFDETRTDRTGVDGVTLDDESQEGVELSIEWELGARTELFVGRQAVDRSYSATQNIDLDVARLGARHELGSRTSLSLTYEHWKEFGQGTVLVDYEADVVTLLLTRDFSRR